MNSDLAKRMMEIITNIEYMKEPELKGLKPEDRGRALGVHQGTTTLAAQFKALLEEEPRKPLISGARVRVNNGPYMTMTGTFMGLESTLFGPQAEVVLGGMDLPILIDQKYLDVL